MVRGVRAGVMDNVCDSDWRSISITMWRLVGRKHGLLWTKLWFLFGITVLHFQYQVALRFWYCKQHPRLPSHPSHLPSHVYVCGHQWVISIWWGCEGIFRKKNYYSFPSLCLQRIERRWRGRNLNQCTIIKTEVRDAHAHRTLLFTLCR